MSRKSIAQIFSPNGSYIPTKCAIHMRPIGSSDPAFVIDGSVVIDAANFKYRDQKKPYIILSETAGYTGGGSLLSVGGSTTLASNAPSISYPIKTKTDGKHYIYIRANNAGSLAIYLDDKFVQNVSYSFGGWGWASANVIFPDDKIHTLSFRFLSPNTQIDKLYISNTSYSPSGAGPDYTTSPYVTVHGRLAVVSNGLPTTFCNAAWAINTIDDITKEGWYNFDTTVLYGTTTASNTYAFVVSVAGATDLHYTVWDTADKLNNPSAYFDDTNVWHADNSTSMSIRVYADFDSLDEYNCVINTPDATLETNTVNDFSPENIHPKHDNTVLVDDNIGGNDVRLDVSEKLLTLVLDQSGSMTWNDNTGLRHQFVSEVIDSIEARYPTPIRLNLLKFNGEPAFSFLVPVKNQITSNDVADIIRESFRDKPQNFAGFRVVRNDKHYPSTPIDGEIVQSGYALAALDIDLLQNKQYYYTIYTYDEFDRFSYGIKIPARTNSIIDAPRGIPAFSLDLQSGLDYPRDLDTVGMWNTDEGQGNYAYDFSDTNADLTLTDTRWTQEYDCPTGHFGLRFNGATSKAESGKTNAFQFGIDASMAIAFWIAPFDAVYHRCVLAYNDGAKNWFSAGLYSDKITFRFVDQEWICNTSIPLDEWTHILIMHDDDGTTVYINGVEKSVSASPYAVPSFVGLFQSNNAAIVIGGNQNNLYDRNFFGKLSHIKIAASLSPSIATPQTRVSALGNPPGKIPPDNGDRLVIANFEIPEDYNYSLVRIVRNHIHMPYHETDGTTVLEIVPIAGKHSYSLPYDYDLDSDYWFRIFTRNALGNWCYIEDSVGKQIHITDQDRLHVIVSCGTGCVTEINPGPGFGSCHSPQITIARGGNQKVHIRWDVAALSDDDALCSLTKIYYREDKFVTFDDKTKWIVNSDSFEGDNAIPIYVAPASVGEWVHRDIDNLKPGFYTVVFADRLGRHSALNNFEIIPLATADDSGIPLLEALDVAYHLLDYDRIKITWKSPVIISSSSEGWFDDKFYIYAAICDMYGKPLPIDFPDNVKITSAISGVVQSNIEDVFNTRSGVDTPDRVPKISFSVHAGGMIIGTVRLRSSPIFSVLKSLSIKVSAEYDYSGTFTWQFPSSTLKFQTPLEMRLVNRDSSYLSTGDLTEPACENGYESGGSDVSKSPYRYRVNGAYIRRKAPFVARALITYKGLPLQQGQISARLFNADGGPCDFSINLNNLASKTLTFAANAFPILTNSLPVLDANGNSTGTETIQSYADIPMKVPFLPQSGRLYVRVAAQAFQSVARMNIYYPSTLRLSLSATAPLGNGADVREQFARAWFIDPDAPRDETKIQIVPDLSIMKWELTKDGSKVRKVPFYSTDSVPLVSGVYSYTRSGTAKFVFFGPAKSGSEGMYKLTVSTTVAGLSVTKDANIEIKIPGSGGFGNYIPDPTAPRIFCEMDECINYLWADGEDWVRMRIFRNPADPNKTLVPDEVNGGFKQAKYADKFRYCSVDDHGNQVLFPLPIGTVVTVNAPGYEIVWGSVTEIKDSTTGLKKLDSQGAFNALDTADITLGRNNYYTVYFRKDAQIDGKGCRDTNASNCCGFDMAPRICADPHEIGDDTGVIVSTKINLAGKPIVITGGGPIGNDDVARPPCVLIPKEPLSFKLVGIFVNNRIVEQMVVDGQTINQFIYEIKYHGMAVPDGVCCDIYLVASIDGQAVTQIGGLDLYTALGLPKTVYAKTVTTYPGTANQGLFSIAVLNVNPIPINHNVAIGIGVSTQYNGKDYCSLPSSSSGGA